MKQAPYHTRLAPTPSGYLHLGNAFNFVLTWALSRRAGGSLRLRIDDIDQERVRPEFVEDIFRSLEWLGLDWDHGPTGPDEFHQLFSQRHRIERYQGVLQQMKSGGMLFACTCSRKDIRLATGTAEYPGTCSRLQRRFDEQETAWRFNDASAAMPFPTLRQKNGSPAYMLASVVDDVDHQITHLVRGKDLAATSDTQMRLARMVPELAAFESVEILHHKLIVDANGQKLSKSQGSTDLRSMRHAGEGPSGVIRQVGGFLGVEAHELADLLV